MVFSISDCILKQLRGASPLISLYTIMDPCLCVVAALGMMAAGGPRPGMQQQLQEGWVASASAPPMGQSGPAQQGVMQGRIGANTAPMRATSQPRPMLHSPMMTNGETRVAYNYLSLCRRYYILKRNNSTTYTKFQI